MDKIILTGLPFFAYHGCLPEEKKNGQTFLIDLTLETDLRAAGESDDLSKSVDYSAVYRLIRPLVEDHTYNLLERLGEGIAKDILAAFPQVQAVTVTVHKPQAPLGGLFADAAIELTRRRDA